MNSLVIQRKEISLIERAERALDEAFGKQEKIPSRYWPEDEEEKEVQLEFVCTHKFEVEEMKARGIKIPETDIYFKCSECNGHLDRNCSFTPDYYGNEED